MRCAREPLSSCDASLNAKPPAPSAPVAGMRIVLITMTIAGLAGAAVAQPSGGSGSGSGAGSAAGLLQPATPAPAGDLKGQCVAMSRAEPAWFREQCTAAIQADKDWNADLFEQVRKWNAQQLLEQSDAVQRADARAIATNKRHVILAYAGMWLVAVAFLILMWRRQQKLVAQIAGLKRDLDAALKDDKK